MSNEIVGKLDTFIHKLAYVFAIIGGIFLTAIALLTFVSVIGRNANLIGLQPTPVPGDFELVEHGCAVAIFFFLPWCQLNGGHVTVDILTNQFPKVLQRFARAIGDFILFVIAFVIAWRLWFGMGDKMPFFEQETRDLLGFGYKPFSTETTFVLGMPVWYGYVLCMIGSVVFVIVCVYTFWRSLSSLWNKPAGLETAERGSA